MRFYRILVLSILGLIFSTSIYAFDVEVNGIYYNLDSSSKTAEVTSGTNKYSGDVVIPATINNNGTIYNVTKIDSYAFDYCTRLTSVDIPNSVTNIGFRAFYECNGLTAVHISDLAAWCNINFDDGTSNPLYSARHLFLNGTEVEDLEVPNSVTIIGEYAFYDCAGLTSVTIPNSVTSIGSEAFGGCHRLNSVNIPNSVTSIGELAFFGCSGLTSIIVDNGNTTYDSRGNCNAIIETSTNTLKLGCKNTVIPNSVASIGSSAFFVCSGLTSIIIPNSVTSIGSSAFQGCSGLTSITIPNSVTSIGIQAFDGCSSLTSIIVDKSNTTYDSRGDCNAIIETSTNTLNFGCKNTTIPNSVTCIGSHAFYYCRGLTSIIIPNSVTNIGSSAFSGCI